MWILILLYATLFISSYLLMSLRRKILKLTYGPLECDPTLIVSFVAPPAGILLSIGDLLAVSLGLREPGYYFNGERCNEPK